MSRKVNHLYEFGSFRLDVGEHLLLRDGAAVPLTPKVFDILLILVESGGRLIEKEELLKAVWPDSFVEEGNLNRNISVLRKALGDSSHTPQYIETVPKLGYRFVAPVREVQAESKHGQTGGAAAVVASDPVEVVTDELAPPLRSEERRAAPLHSSTTPSRRRRFGWKPLAALSGAIALTLVFTYFWRQPPQQPRAAAEEISIQSIAVLPFKTAGAEEGEQYLGIGLTDALVNKLGGLRQITVRPTSAVLKYGKAGQDPLAAGRALGVDAVLDGVVQKSGERVRVTAQLLRTRDGTPLWAQTLDEPWTNIFAVQDAILGRINEALALNLTVAEKQQIAKRYTDNAEAYRLYLQGNYLVTKRTADGLKKGTEYLQRAIELDPNFALAYAGLASSLIEPRPGLKPKEAYRKQKELALKALSIDETLHQAYPVLAFAVWRGDWDWTGAERSYQRAIELEPNYSTAHHAYGVFLASQGRSKAAITELSLAHSQNPTSLSIMTMQGFAYIYARRHDDAIERFRKLLELEPKYSAGHAGLGLAYGYKGMYAKAIESLEQAAELEQISNAGILGYLGHVYALSGKRVDVLRTLDEIIELENQGRGSWGAAGVIHTALGDKDQAFASLEKAFANHEWWLSSLKVNPLFDNLRSDPRYSALLQRTGLAP